MDKGWLYFRKSDRKVLMFLLAIGLIVATLLVLFFTPSSDEKPRIEQPEHWWEKE